MIQGEPEHQDAIGRGDGPGRRRAEGHDPQDLALLRQEQDRASGADDQR